MYDKLTLLELFNDDCFNIFPTIEDNKVNLFILDLPYANKKFGNCTSCKWDTPIDLNEMWIQIKRIMKPNAIIVFFCNVKFGYALIHSNPKWFRYDLIYAKTKKVGFLNCNRAPLRQHENIYVFNIINYLMTYYIYFFNLCIIFISKYYIEVKYNNNLLIYIYYINSYLF